MKLTKEQKKFYLKHKGNKCPFCKGEVQSQGTFEYDEDWAEKECECNDCGKVWKDVYTLSDVVDAE